MAEGVGFEPTDPFRDRWFSRPVPLTARTPLRAFGHVSDDTFVIIPVLFFFVNNSIHKIKNNFIID
jgi:hypothetical protein